MDASIQKNKIFFPNLDGLRFVCFLAVFLYHCNETIFPKISNPKITAVLNFLFRNGNLGVNIFFVLSGFLITFLLIKEKEFKNTISLKNFYVRRILRIWPLFYLCVFLGFAVFPFFKYRTIPSPVELSNFWSYIFFSGNFNFIKIWPAPPDALNLIVLWSVAVEEQFYLTWPIILKYFSKEIYPYIFIIIILITLIFRSFFTSNYPVLHFHTLSVIGDMALGGLAAYGSSSSTRFYNFIVNMKQGFIIAVYSFTIIIILFKNYIFSYSLPVIFERVVLGSLFAFIITEQNFARRSFFKFSRYKIISSLGIYTYGLYCLHFFGILIVEKVVDKFQIPVNTLFASIISVVAALLITIFLSYFSYHLFEKWFLRLKDRFAF
ncbi:MAG TPA: acyltransferase [Chitinophagaceae bacterium]|nr:acyltransferase [Chitinophagaceae bacterium]